MSIKAAFFVKNVPGWERALRFSLGAGAIYVGLAMLAPPLGWIAAASGAGFALTGVLGFCPMCAMVGRRVAARE